MIPACSASTRSSAALGVPRGASTCRRFPPVRRVRDKRYFDRSVDGGRDGGDDAVKKPSIAKRLRKAIFFLPFKAIRLGLKSTGTYQHVLEPRTIVNYVTFRFFGVPAAVTAKAEFARETADELAAARALSNGTVPLSAETARVVFDAPRVSFGRRGRLNFEVTGPVGAAAGRPLHDVRRRPRALRHRGARGQVRLPALQRDRRRLGEAVGAGARFRKSVLRPERARRGRRRRSDSDAPRGARRPFRRREDAAPRRATTRVLGTSPIARQDARVHTSRAPANHVRPR